MNYIIKTQEFNCTCCGESFLIQITRNGEINIFPKSTKNRTALDKVVDHNYVLGIVEGGEKDGF
jgi:hypothetical protein